MNPSIKSFWISTAANVFVLACIGLFWYIQRQNGGLNRES